MTKRVLILTLIFVLVPIFTGIYCPCAKAAPPQTLLISETSCHGCCPQIGAAPDTYGELANCETVFPVLKKFQSFNDLKALSPDASRDIAINRRALVPAGDEPLESPQPLFLSLQVLRI